ncbi:MAG TPA: hypothetical protein VK194_05925, partial [Candidatus Deferrimicrobium sp.]|nr:hypothetical protein [Candidatus Deferrimicrobium sp.]
TEHDYRVARPIRGTVFDTAFCDLERDRRGLVEVQLRDPASGRALALWADAAHRWLQVFTADTVTPQRGALAVEPMTAPPDAFRSGEDLVVLAPAGDDGDEHSASWGIRSL